MSQSGDPAKRARAIVQAVSRPLQFSCDRGQRIVQVTHYNNPKLLAEVSENLGPAMVGLTMSVLIHVTIGSFLTFTQR